MECPVDHPGGVHGIGLYQRADRGGNGQIAEDPRRMVFQTAATCYYIGNEGLSIVENAGIIGVPVPAGLKRAMEQLRDKNDNTGGDDDDKPPKDPAE